MQFDDIKHVAVIGAGDMGHGIAEVALITGFTVSLYDIKYEFVEKGKNLIDWSLNKLAEKGKISDNDHNRFKDNLSLTIDLKKAVNKADIVIEAAPEKLDLKLKIFNDLDKFSPNHSILASNTSNMSINEIAKATNRPEKVCGLHFFNPPIIMKLVEITRGDKTSEETVQLMLNLTKKMSKVPIVCQKDSPGFIVNRINGLSVLYLHLMLDHNEYEPAKLDAAAMNMGMKMGLYELADFVGLDVIYDSRKYLETRLSADYAPTPTLERLVKSNKLGKKTGEGIYKWPAAGRPSIDLSDPADFDLMNLLRVQVNESAKVLAEGLATAQEIDTGLKLGMNNPIGPLEFAENIDLAELTDFLDGLAKKYNRKVFLAHEWIRDGSLIERLKS
ncbi:MAG: 3-hydroxyacyl-CoA dehydrogenase NAD-binding domain-containing protein [Candidatus Hodarchaeales archaeon]